MTLGEWLPQPIAPAKALIGQHGDRGAIDAKLATNYAPMTEAYADGVWKKVMHEFTQRYPKRFGEVWVYLGPVYLPESSNYGSAISPPDAFYIIAFDITDEGGLRALTLLIPTDAENKNLNDYLSSIAEIEKLTGLQFLPELDFSIRETLGEYSQPIYVVRQGHQHRLSFQPHPTHLLRANYSTWIRLLRHKRFDQLKAITKQNITLLTADWMRRPITLVITNFSKKYR
jgi:endonuclease G